MNRRMAELHPLLAIANLVLAISIPTLIVWKVLRAIPSFPTRGRVAVAAFIGALPLAVFVFWADATEGFCCREYPATVWTELPGFGLMVLMFAVLGYLVAAVAERLASRVRR